MIIGYNFLNKGEVYEKLYLIPLRGVDTISGFTDSITGQAVQRFFIKEFQYTKDGINFTEYESLTNLALSNVIIDEKDDLLIRIRYTRSGTDSSGSLLLNSFRIDATYTLKGLQILSFKRDGVLSLFSVANKSFNDSWCNFFDKIYHYGIVPTYIKRGDTDYDDFSEDDFITFFKSICYFYSLMDFLNEKNVSDFFSFRDGFSDFLSQRNVFLSGDESIEILQKLRNKHYRNITKRGTDDVFYEEGTFLTPSSAEPHGEMRRILNYEYSDLFLHDFSGKGLSGFYLDTFSPTDYTDFYKAKGFNLFSQFTGTGLGIAFDSENNITYDIDQSEFCVSNQFKVDYKLPFLIQFSVSKDTAAGRFTVELIAKDYSNVTVNLQNHQTPNATNNTLAASVNVARTAEYFTFYGVINPLGSSSIDPSSTNLGVGNNLRFSTDTQSLIVKVTNSSGATSKIRIGEIFITPIFSFSKTYINSSPIISVLMSSNKSKYANVDLLKRDIKRFLIPYCCFLNLQFVDNEVYFSENETYGWLLPDGNYWLTSDGEPWLLNN